VSPDEPCRRPVKARPRIVARSGGTLSSWGPSWLSSHRLAGSGPPHAGACRSTVSAPRIVRTDGSQWGRFAARTGCYRPLSGARTGLPELSRERDSGPTPGLQTPTNRVAKRDHRTARDCGRAPATRNPRLRWPPPPAAAADLLDGGWESAGVYRRPPGESKNESDQKLPIPFPIITTPITSRRIAITTRLFWTSHPRRAWSGLAMRSCARR
jgi:hypothetical protein